MFEDEHPRVNLNNICQLRGKPSIYWKDKEQTDGKKDEPKS